MSLSDESFPDDDLLIEKEDVKLESFEKTKSLNSSVDNSTHSTVGQSSSGTSNDIKSGDDRNSSYSKKNKILKQKSYSYQDLHSDYSKKRFKHVKSKVKEYIENMKAQDRQRDQLTRHKSLPETLTGFSNYQIIDDNIDSNEITQLLQQKDQEVHELKTLNEYLENNLEEKSKMLAALKRKEDIMRIELFELKEREKEKRYSSVDRFRYQLSLYHVSTATQTEHTAIEDTSNGLEVINSECSLLNLTENDNQFNLRKRAYSNSLIYDGDTVKNLSHSTIINKDNLSKVNEDNFKQPLNGEALIANKLKKRRKTKKIRSWKRFMYRTMLCCFSGDDSPQNDYLYTQISFSDAHQASLLSNN